MESSWRQNVANLIGANRVSWLMPGGFPTTIVELCAELNPYLVRNGKVWSHLIKYREEYGGWRAGLARSYPNGSNTLNEILFLFGTTTAFPYGIPVVPDHA